MSHIFGFFCPLLHNVGNNPLSLPSRPPSQHLHNAEEARLQDDATTQVWLSGVSLTTSEGGLRLSGTAHGRKRGIVTVGAGPLKAKGTTPWAKDDGHVGAVVTLAVENGQAVAHVECVKLGNSWVLDLLTGGLYRLLKGAIGNVVRHYLNENVGAMLAQHGDLTKLASARPRQYSACASGWWRKTSTSTSR